MPIAPSVAQARSRLGNAARRGTPADVLEARRQLAEANIAEAIRRVVDAAPPLTPEQRDRLALLLRAPRGGTPA
jgi:hypothetical protein